jgi:cytochrome c-type biogenesis protein CcmH/NrfG
LLCTAAQTYTTLVPDDESGWCLLSEVSTRLGEHEDALTAALKAVDLNSESLDGLFHVGTALMSLSRNADAEEYFHR